MAAIIMILTNQLHNKAKRLKAEKNTVRPLESSSWKVHLPDFSKSRATFAVSFVAVCSMRDVAVEIEISG
jgi:hypothetical protein